ncbi:MAG: DUF7507 domain-containing protein, partial [Spirulinaceae cyanobacterium]
SSAAGIGGGTINYVAPDGTTGTCGSTGFIANSTQESNGPVGSGSGGFDPCEVVVGAGQAGIWEVQFISPNPDAGGVGRPREPVGGSWSPQTNDDFFISAWDITVVDLGGSVVNGRAYANYLPLRVSTGDTTKQLNSELLILTKDGYQYQVGFNNIEPQGFIFFANNKGFTTTGDNNPSFQSVQFEGADPGDPPAGFGFHDPENNDTTGAGGDITHKLFFNLPDASTEDIGDQQTPDGTSTWWLQTADIPPDPQNFQFVGEEGTVGQAGSSPLTGAFEFENTSNINLSYTIAIDIDRNGVIEDNGQDVILVGTATPGANSVDWDGLDGQGNAVPAGDLTYQIAGVLNGGEAHFPLIDVENNANGLIINRCDETIRTSCSSVSSTVYFDDVSDTNLIGGSKNLAGVDSSSGAHAWSGNFGNIAGIDTWVNVPSNPFTLQASLTIAEADLELTKTATPDSLAVGQDLTYTLVAANNGPTSVDTVIINDQLPSQIDPDSIVITCTVPTGSSATCGTEAIDTGTGAVTLTTGDLPNGSELEYTITGTITSIGTGSIVNDALIERPDDVRDPDCPSGTSSNDCDRNISETDTNNRDSVTTTVTDGTTLTIEKQEATPDNPTSGNVTYDIVITNTGSSAAQDVVFTDTIPDGFTFVAGESSGCTFTATATEVSCTLAADLAAGDSTTITLVFNTDGYDFAGGTTIQNTATADGSNTDPATDTADLDLVADITVAKALDTASSGTSAGDNFTYTVTITNNSNQYTAYGVTAQDQLATGATFVSASDGGTESGGVVTWDVGNLDPGETVTRTVTVTLPNNETYTNTASVSSDNDDPNIDNNDDSVDTTLPLLGTDIDIQKTAAGDFTAGETIDYTITITNIGTADATNVVVTDTSLDGIFTLQSVSSSGGETCTISSAPDPDGFSCDIGTLPSDDAQQTRTITATYLVPVDYSGPTDVTNTASVDFDNDNDPDNNDASETVSQDIAELTLTKDVTPTEFAAGDTLTYTITLENIVPTGASTAKDATNVVIEDAVLQQLVSDGHVTLASQSGCTVSFADFVCNIGTIAASNTHTVTFTLDVADPYTGDTTLTNTVTVDFDNDADPDNNEDSATANLSDSEADVVTTKDGPTSGDLGEFTYTITTLNDDNSAALTGTAVTATNVVVQDQIATGAAFVDASTVNGIAPSFDAGTGIVSWDVGDLDPGESISFTVTVRFDTNGTYTNTASSTADTTDPDTDNNDGSSDDAQVSTTAPAVNPNLRLVKRITDVSRNGSSLGSIDFSSFVDDPSDDNDTAAGWANLGQTLAGVYTIPSSTELQSGDIVEYTIYFLSDGDADLDTVEICDAIPAGTTFLPDSFSSSQGIRLLQSGITTDLTNATDTDPGSYITPLTPVSSPCTPTNNPNGSVFVTFTTLVVDEVGYIRFRVQVD